MGGLISTVVSATTPGTCDTIILFLSLVCLVLLLLSSTHSGDIFGTPVDVPSGGGMFGAAPTSAPASAST